ncbi:MAG: hypothetical protein MUC58_08700, partial [Rhizobiaceae bacterium]|nr:hypothetical protein [Rhizobiaceae bacterium]
FGVVAALWFYYGEVDRWRLIVAFDGLKSDLENKYKLAADIIHHVNIEKTIYYPILDLSRVRIVHKSDPLIQGLNQIIQYTGVGKMAFSANLVNGIYVEDALIYRMAA